MSTFEIDKAKIIDWLFPESNWKELESPKFDQIIEYLSGIEDLKSEVVDYLKRHHIKIGIHEQFLSGGGWTILRNITLQPGWDHMHPYILSLIIHETYHLKQSILTRLSMQGELRAWQYQKRTYPAIAKASGNAIGAEREAYGGTRDHWEIIGGLSPDSRADLEKARDVMKHIARGYRADRLPLYPLPQEVWYHLKQGNVGDAIKVVLNLVRGGSDPD